MALSAVQDKVGKKDGRTDGRSWSRSLFKLCGVKVTGSVTLTQAITLKDSVGRVL